MVPDSAAGVLGRHWRRFAGAGLSVVLLGTAELMSPALSAESAAAHRAPGARLSDAVVAALPGAARRLLADASWLLAIQHYGNRRRAGLERFPRLAGLIENALRLDPGLRPAAVVGALLVAEAPPLGAGEPRRADRFLRDWTEQRPEDFEAVLMRALLHHWHLEDPAQGARILERAQARGETPPWFTAVAARSLAKVGSREAARGLWRALEAQAGDARTRTNARTHLLQLDALDQRDRLARMVEAFRRAEGRIPRDWNELIAAGLLREAPVDPAGVAFVLPRDGIPRIARSSPLAGYPGR